MKKILIPLIIGTIAISIAACDHPAQRTGEAIDSAAYSTKSAVQDVTGTKGPAQSAGEKVDKTADNISN